MQLTMDNNYYNDLAIKAVEDIEAFNELYDYYFLVFIIFYLHV